MSSMFVEPGVYKKRNNRGEDPLFNPLSEEQYQVVKNNPYSRFVELPWPLSRESKRRGYILYGEKNSVERDIQDLSDWTNVQLEKIRAGEADPIEVAAEFQWRYVSIHPMIDGNGRTSMLLANRILEEADLPPILMTFSGYDIYYTPKVWSEKIKEAIFDFEQMVNDSKFLASIEKETPNLHMSNFSDGPRMALTPESFSKGVKKSAVNRLNGKIESRWPLLKRELFAANENQEVNIGNQRFVAMMDGFFYSNMGVPHAIHSEIINGQKQYKLYPVADSVGVLYSMGGMSSNKRFFQRSMNPFMRDHFREFFGFLKIYEKTPDMGSRVNVLDYSLVESANKAGQFFLHDWQRPLLKAALEIKDTDPLKVLAPGRGYHSQYEKSIHFGHKTNLHEVLAQYTMMELKYSKMESYARSNSMTEEIQIIQASRKKLFQAAKTLLAEKTVALERALTETPEKFPSSQEWQFFLSYYRVSPMKYKDFESYAASKDANNVVLIRADQGASRYLGFISNALFRELIDKLPLNETPKSYMNKLDSALAPNASKAQKDFLDSSLIYKSLKSRITDLPRMISDLAPVWWTRNFVV
ncbi:MAG: Fic family protein [Bdellovibrionaceae bacterium]|nr:Fic family protein [Pseudobdellovibrionaceae bacterium]